MSKSIKTYQPPSFNLVNFVILAFVIYCVVVYKYAFNFPYLDDFDAILDFLNRYDLAAGKESFVMLLGQHNEHRIFLTHLFSVATLKLFGSIYFPILIFLGNIGWFCVAIVFWQYAKKNAISFSEFLPVPLVLLAFSHWGMMTWAMTSIQQYWQILFCVLCIYFLTKGRLLPAGIFSVLAAFTGGGGLALAPLAILYFLIRRQWSLLLVCIVFFSAVLFVYFHLLPYSPPGTGRLLETFAHPIRFGAFFLGYLGGAFNVSLLGPLSFIVGGLILATLLLRNWRAHVRQNDFLTWVILFILICAVLATINRSHLGMEAGGASHYSVYSLLLICCIYLRALTYASGASHKKRLSFLCALAALLLFSYWLWRAPFYLEDRRHLLNHGYIIYPDRDGAKQVLENSKNQRIFNSPVPITD
ncbi:hypothetical protein [Polynucleobacter sp. AP-Latsch-80-C2]|uniref:hypothetical protein n=1 Tax=Polynucleobacter sp. AP-Latsch-80-C2 TaxID=2576931 RepID=UPI001C0BE75E|nr:hypothetical protein [Polynucleobacter sp. AP-Latsch-80-C2]MBU3624561.1 hypothetical protein [Polynucleobacter sp. AP-Latsch-80-C2]